MDFNYAVICTRRMVECVFGRLKRGKFPLLMNSRLTNPVFNTAAAAAQVAYVACGLHSIVAKATGHN